MTDKEKLSLTEEQEKAFKAFEKAHKRCKKSGIIFYTVLSTMTAINGEHLVRIHDDQERGDLDTNYLSNPYVDDIGFSGWADDTHYAEVK